MPDALPPTTVVPAPPTAALPTGDLLAGLLLVREVEEFLYREAHLLDTYQYSTWLNLLTEDVRYFMPMRRNVRSRQQATADTREGEDISWFDEDKFTLEQRVRQIETGVHWAEEPLSRTTHMVSNVTVIRRDPTMAPTAEVTVGLCFLIYRNRVETETDIFVGKRQDTLRRCAEGWKIARRMILLDQSVLKAKNLTTFF